MSKRRKTDKHIYGWVYKVVNKVNGKIYIGATTQTIHSRWVQHVYSSLNGYKKGLFNKAIMEFGENNFKVNKIKTCFSEEHLNTSEIYFVEFYNSNNPDFGYNRSTGGKYPFKGVKKTDEERKKQSEYMKGVKKRTYGRVA